MDVIIGWYVFFAIVTAITAVYELGYPVFAQIMVEHPDHDIAHSIWVSEFVFLLIAFAFAPPIFIICIVPSMGEKFRKKMFETLTR